MSGRSYERAKTVVEATEDADPTVRKIAEEEVEKMDATGSPRPSDDAVRDARRSHLSAGKYASWDKTGKRYKDTARKTVERTWTGLHSVDVVCPALAEMDAALIAGAVETKELEEMCAVALKATRHLRQFVGNLRERM